jgi:UDP-GlcNAc:undecaprenyl-phosphate GlcNAc-1-phosphate transferase
MIAGTDFHQLIFIGALFPLSAAITWLMIRVRIIDRPNLRSSHQRPVPRGGGVAIVVAAAIGLTIYVSLDNRPPLIGVPLIGLSVGAFITAAAGFLDDLNILDSFKSKLLFQLLACLVALSSGIVIDELPVPFNGSISLGWWGYPVTLLWILGLTNIVNFMDGLDGLAAGTAAIAAAVFGLAGLYQGTSFVHVLGGILFVSCAGFFVFNFPRAKIFMGDVGSQFLGFAMAAVAVLAAKYEGPPLAILVVPLLFFNFIFDAVFTFCRRSLARENVTAAHRSHLYQLLNQMGWSHAKVSLFHFVVAGVQGVSAFILVMLPAANQPLVFVPFLVFQIFYAGVIVRRAKREGVL